MRRRGFTLTELLVGMAVAGILGTALMRLVVSSSQFVSRQEAQLEARQTARATFHLISNDLRMLPNGGVSLATPTEVDLNVPYAWGVLCRTVGSVTVASLMPIDSAQYASAQPALVGWRQPDGTYKTTEWPTISTSTNLAACTADSIRVVPGGRLIEINLTDTVPPGTLMFLGRTARYSFKASLAMPGRIALFRQESPAPEQEMIGPFTSDTRFRFLTGSRLTPQDAPPANLDSLLGLELVLVAESEQVPTASSAPARFELRARVKFLNSYESEKCNKSGKWGKSSKKKGKSRWRARPCEKSKKK